jgi:hypothetical protein
LGYKEAKDIKQGDLVWTHLGEWYKVTRVYCRKYAGSLKVIKTMGLSDPLYITPEHPVFITRTIKCPYSKSDKQKYKSTCKPNCKKQYSCYGKNNKTCKKPYLTYTNNFIEGALLTPKSDYTPFPIIKGELINIGYTKEHFWLFGLFLAEGDYLKGSGLRFNLGKHETQLINKLNSHMDKLYNLSPHYDEHGQGTKRVIFYSTKLVQLFNDLFGKGATTKKIPFDFLWCGEENLQSLLEGYIDGDGYRRKNKSVDSFYTSSPFLKDMFQLILIKNRIPYSVLKRHPKISYIDSRPIISKNPGWSFSFSRDRIKNMQYWKDVNYMYRPITSITEEYYEGDVFNFEVEIANSYTANGVVVHNCLRELDTRIQDGRLHFFPRFRSWDLWGGFPANLAAIQILKEYMASEIGVEDGEIIASSKGLHLYGYAEEIAKLRRGC